MSNRPLLNISGAFDTLNHKRLQQRAEDLCGFTGQPILLLNHIYRTVKFFGHGS